MFFNGFKYITSSFVNRIILQFPKNNKVMGKKKNYIRVKKIISNHFKKKNLLFQTIYYNY